MKKKSEGRGRQRGAIVFEVVAFAPFVLLILIVVTQFTGAVMQAWRNLVEANRMIEAEILTRGGEVPIEDRPCLEALGGEGVRRVEGRTVRVLSRDVSLPKEVTFVVRPICDD